MTIEEKQELDRIINQLEQEFKTEIKFTGYGWDYRDNTSFACFLINKTRKYSVPL